MEWFTAGKKYIIFLTLCWKILMIKFRKSAYWKYFAVDLIQLWIKYLFGKFWKLSKTEQNVKRKNSLINWEKFIVCKRVPAHFLRHPPLDPACPLFKVFAFPPLFSIPTLKVFQTVPPTSCRQTFSCPNLTHQLLYSYTQVIFRQLRMASFS